MAHKTVNTKQASLNTHQLSLAGLNLQAIFNLKDLPPILCQIEKNCSNLQHYSQLILIGHAGNLLWQKLKQSDFDSVDPIDDYSTAQTFQFFSERLSTDDFEIIFPTEKCNEHPISLQALGGIAGWHNQSPLLIGINQQWGTWFAYRAVVLVKSNYQLSEKKQELSPCLNCNDKICINACPAKALEGETLNIGVCLKYRLEPDSKCKDRCLARMVCPVGKEHQYSIKQIQYHYSQSHQVIVSKID